MGTRGHLFIRCRGRYFIYYNQFDSYPEGLGEAIVSRIPQDPKEYRKWLESMRELYSRIVQQFEEHYLPVVVEVGQEDTEVSDSELYSKCFLALDDRLEIPPLLAMSCDHINNLFIELTYTLDLDREVLSVDDAAHFQLSKIPRDGRWIEYVSLDSLGRRILDPDTPKEIIGNVEWRPDVQGGGQSLLAGSDIKIVTPKTSIDAAGAPYWHLLLTTFETVQDTYRELLERYILGWKPGDFPFREMAFAILSLAAGEVAFECPKVLDRSHGTESYFLIPDSKLQHPQQKLLPKFLSESHVPGVPSGSAPQETTFWFGNTLVYLTSRLDLVEVEEASVAEVVKVGLSQGLKSFNALVFSVLDFVLMQAELGQNGSVHVKRSPLMVLFYFSADSPNANGPRSRTDTTSSKSEIELASFIALIHFFNAAADQSLVGTKSSILPNEVLRIIMQLSDTRTYHRLAKVSSYCRNMACTRFRLNDDYAVVGMQQKTSKFILEGTSSGDKIESGLTVREHDALGSFRDTSNDGLALSPVIGIADVNRTSVMDFITLCFSKATPKGPLWEKRRRFPKQTQFSQYYWSSDPKDHDPYRALDIPEYAYSGAVEEAWGRYLNEMLKGDTGLTTPISAASYRCLLLPNFRELKSDLYYRNEVRAFVRHVRYETPEEWEKSQGYAIRELVCIEPFNKLGRRDRLEPSRGCFIVVAFGTRFKLFYYVYHNPDPQSVSPATDNSYSRKIAVGILDPNPEHRLIQLSPEEKVLNLIEDEGKTYLEHWMGLIRGSYFDKQVVYEPIVDKYVPVPVTKDN